MQASLGGMLEVGRWGETEGGCCCCGEGGLNGFFVKFFVIFALCCLIQCTAVPGGGHPNPCSPTIHFVVLHLICAAPASSHQSDERGLLRIQGT